MHSGYLAFDAVGSFLSSGEFAARRMKFPRNRDRFAEPFRCVEGEPRSVQLQILGGINAGNASDQANLWAAVYFRKLEPGRIGIFECGDGEVPAPGERMAAVFLRKSWNEDERSED